jgi:PAS domain S-box-containing protein
MISLTLRKRIVIFAVALLSLTVGCLIVGIWGLHQVRVAERKASIADKIHGLFDELQVLFAQILMGPHDYIIHGDKGEPTIFQQDFEKLLSQKNQLETLIESKELGNALELEGVLTSLENQLVTINARLPEFKMMAADIFSLELPVESHKASFYMEEMDFFVRKLQDDLGEEATALAQLSAGARERIHSIQVFILSLLIVFGVSAVLVGIVLSYYLIRSITRPVDNLLQVTRKIQGGDLTARAKVETQDEISELAGSFNEMVRKLMDTQERISSIFDGSGDAMWVIDRNFNVIQANRQMEKLSGMRAAEIGGAKCYEVFPGDLCHSSDCILKRILRGEQWLELETTKEARDGRKIPVELVATPLHKRGKIEGAIESFRDITARQTAQEALRESQERLSGVVASLTDHTAMIDEENNILWTNDVAKELFGANLKGNKCFAAYYGRDKACEACIVKKTFEDGKIYEHETELMGPDGSPVYFWCTASVAERHRDGRPKIVLEVFRNITDRKRAEAEKRQSYYSGMAEMASGILHNIRNTLNPMIVDIDILRQDLNMAPIEDIERAQSELADGTTPADRRKDLSNFLDFAYRNLSALAKKMRGSLDAIARRTTHIEEILPDGDKLSHRQQPMEVVKLEEMIRDSVALMPDYLRGNVSMEINPSVAKMKPIKAHRISLVQVVANILVNAAESIRKFGTISGTIHIGTDSDNMDGADMIHLKICDNGEGIKASNVDRIFERGFTTKPEGSSGIGLHWCANTITAMKGRLYAESDGIGHGACFHLLLPVNR